MKPYDLISADKSRVRAVLAPFAPLDRFWMTYRLPFCRAVVTYPPDTLNPERSGVLRHEEHHVAQFAPWYGPFLVALAMVLPLPVLLSGRWFVERGAYLGDIRAGLRTVDGAVDALWSGYWAPWPRAWMRSWFEKQLTKDRKPWA